MPRPKIKPQQSQQSQQPQQSKSVAVEQALIQAAASEKVQRAYESLLLRAAAHYLDTFERGSVDRKDKVAQVLAVPAVRQVLSPTADKADTADVEEFHRTRREMMGLDDSD